MIELPRPLYDSMLQRDEAAWLAFVCESIEGSHPMSPLFALPPDERPEKARDWCDRARANGLSTDDDVLGFVLVMHEISPGFDQHPALRAALDRDDAPPSERWRKALDAHDEALERAWREVDAVGWRDARDWHIERYARIEEAFPLSHADPRFAGYFRAVHARRHGR
ncbi:MAG: hypothetical protein U0326_20065 [Polyangiales bacterium]